MSGLTKKEESQSVRGSNHSRRRKSSYRKSREVTMTSSQDSRGGRTPIRRMTKFGKRWRRYSKPKRCPKAPHNTTSFLMNFHKSENMRRKPQKELVEEDGDMDSVIKDFNAYGSFLPKFKSIPADMLSVNSFPR